MKFPDFSYLISKMKDLDWFAVLCCVACVMLAISVASLLALIWVWSITIVKIAGTFFSLAIIAFFIALALE